MANQANIYDGLWKCSYWYPSNEFVGDTESEYRMKVRQNGNILVFESLPNNEGSYMLVRLTIEDGIATGTWHETTSPTGLFKGATYNGAGQLVVRDSGNLEGKRAGAGYDHKLKEMQIYSGNWEITRKADK